MKQNNNPVEMIRESNSLEEVMKSMVDDFKGFTQDGSNRLRCLCPFHEESDPSFKVYLETDTWYCFGCGKGGDLFNLVQELKQVDFKEACNILAERAGLPVPAWNSQDKLIESKREVEDLLGIIAEYYHNALLASSSFYDQLKKDRCFSDDTIKDAKLGLANNNGLLDYLTSQNTDIELARRIGILADDGREYFSDRIVIPYLHRGRVVYMSGRSINNQNPKYLNLPVNDLVKRIPYNADSIFRLDDLFIVEGFSDALTLKEWGFNVISLTGTGITNDECQLINNHNKVYIALDGDARIQAINLAKTVIRATGIICQIVELPINLDPNEFKNQGHSSFEFEQLISHSESLTDILVKDLIANGSGQDQRLKEFVGLLPMVSDIDLLGIQEKVCKKLGIKHNHFESLIKIAREENKVSHEEVIDDSTLALHPALDFKNDMGIVCVTLQVKKDDFTFKRPYLITSDRQMISYQAGIELKINDHSISLCSKPSTLEGDIRWEKKDIDFFIAGESSDPQSVYIDTLSVLNKYVDFSNNDTSKIVALWIIGTYIFPIFEAYPYIHYFGMKGSGKTKMLNLLEKLAFNTISMSSITSSTLFRIIQDTRATLGIDEAENLINIRDANAADISKILNSGYKKGGLVYRSVKEDDIFKAKGYEVYSPKAIASIRDIGDVLASRCIPVNMLRTYNPDKGNLIISDTGENWSRMRGNFYNLALTCFKEIREIYHNDESIRILTNRENELWLPLFSIAKFLERHGISNLLAEVSGYAQQNTKDTSTSSLTDVEEIFLKSLVKLTLYKSGTVSVTTKQIKAEMLNRLDEETLNKIPSQRIGYWFRNFNLSSGSNQKARNKEGMIYILDINKILDVMKRYGVESDPVQGNMFAEKAANG